MYNVQILPSAWEDLKRIEDWYLINFSAESAEKVSNGILNAIDRLAMFPDSGSPMPDGWLNAQGYRMVISKSYVAIYRKIDMDVYVYHIANTKAEYTKLFYYGT